MPNQTLYVKNLNEKVPLKDMRKALETIFSPFGEIEAIEMWKNIRMRGQAFVVYKDLESSQRALEGTPNFLLFGKPLVVKEAQKKSDVTAKREGTLEENKRAREETQDEKAAKFQTTAHKALRNSLTKEAAGYMISAGEKLEPNKILFVQNIPAGVSDTHIHQILQMYPGFREVRVVPGRQDIAFVEFETEQHASVAKDTLHGYQLVPEKAVIKVTFARK